MSKDIDEGCACLYLGSLGMAPCRWCTSLTQTEVDLLDTYGMEVLRWLQTHYLLYKGEWDWEDGPEATSLEEFINSSIILAQDDINLRKGKFTKAYMMGSPTISPPHPSPGLAAALAEINPKVEVHIFSDGMMLPKKILHSAEIIDFASYRRKRTT